MLTREVKVRNVRIIVLAALAALALTAWGGAGSAFAFETTLCKTGTESPYCKSSDAYPAGSTLRWETEEVEITTSIENVFCESQLNLETIKTSGSPSLPVRLTSWTFSECYAPSSGLSCEASVSNLPYQGSLTRTKSSNGTLNLGSGGTGEPLLSLTCQSGLSCSWSAAELPYGDGGHLGDAALIKKSGFVCPTTASIQTHAYYPTVASFLAVPGERPPRTTSICRGFEEYCEPANLLAKGTLLIGTAADFTVKTPAGYGGGNFTCKSTNLTAETGAAYAEPLPVNSTEFFPKECTWGFGGCEVPSVSQYKGSVSHSNADGSWKGGGLSWQFRCGLSVACRFTVKEGSTILIEHGNPATIKMSEVPLIVTEETTVCPKEARASGTFKLPVGSGPMYFSDVLR